MSAADDPDLSLFVIEDYRLYVCPGDPFFAAQPIDLGHAFVVGNDAPRWIANVLINCDVPILLRK